MKILYVANIHRHFNAFHKPYLKLLSEMGHEVHVVANGDDKVSEVKNQFFVDIQRSPYKLKNVKAYFQLKKLIEHEAYDVVHCHTPMGGILARLASISRRRKGMKVIYTAHGFHFCKGGPKKNWILYYPVEKFMARHTDVIITINNEDYKTAEKFDVLHHFAIPGIGLEIDKFRESSGDFNRQNKRAEIGVNSDDILIISIGDLSKRKNHQVIIRAIAKLPYNKIKYVICGKGEELEHLKEISSKLGVSDRILLLGFREDIKELLKASDIFAFPSLWEGLGIAGIEAMAAGIPVIASDRHGIKDYAIDGETALLCNPTNPDEFANAIQLLIENNVLADRLISNSYSIINKFDTSNAMKAMKDIYEMILN